MKYHYPCARSQCAADVFPDDPVKFQTEYRSLYCAKCFASRLERAYFYDFVRELLDRWRELRLLKQLEEKIIELCGDQHSSHLTDLRARLKCRRFTHIRLPNDDEVELQLEKAKWDFQIERKPALVLVTPRRCMCRASGRRPAIDRFIAPLNSWPVPEMAATSNPPRLRERGHAV